MGSMASEGMTTSGRIRLPGNGGSPYRVLALGAHPDDIEIGCAATLMRLLDDASVAALRWVVLTGTANRADEARASAAALAGETTLELSVEAFSDGFLPWRGDEVKRYLEGLKAFAPDVVFTHRLEDAHQDHRLVSELTWQTFRSEMIIEYEIPKYDGDLGHPNLYVSVAADLAQRKVEHLCRHFPSQLARQWFSADTFHSLLRLRGVEANSPTGLAEAFTCRKVLL